MHDIASHLAVVKNVFDLIEFIAKAFYESFNNFINQ